MSDQTETKQPDRTLALANENAPAEQQEGYHVFRSSAELRKLVEGARHKGKWSREVRGLFDHNSALTESGSFKVSGAGTIQVPKLGAAQVIKFGGEGDGSRIQAPRFSCTEFCVANCDSLTAALAMGDSAILSFANPDIPGGRYVSGGLAQEEDLCRLLPQLYPTLVLSKPAYPISAGTALLTQGLMSIRQPGTYDLCPSLGDVSVITAAMPCGMADKRPKGGWLHSDWADTVRLRIRSVLHAAALSGHVNLVLGAFGCGAFGNPATPVANIFKTELASPEFRGQFAKVVFAIIDPMGTGNLKPFLKELADLEKMAAMHPLAVKKKTAAASSTMTKEEMEDL